VRDARDGKDEETYLEDTTTLGGTGHVPSSPIVKTFQLRYIGTPVTQGAIMKTTIVNLIVATTMAFSGTALAAGETESKVQPPAASPVAAASAVQPATTAESTPPAPAPKPQHAPKDSTTVKSAKTKPMRAKDLDLRHCLDLENNAAIAKCAGE
jgi:hypothetical protein